MKIFLICNTLIAVLYLMCGCGYAKIARERIAQQNPNSIFLNPNPVILRVAKCIFGLLVASVPLLNLFLLIVSIAFPEQMITKTMENIETTYTRVIYDNTKYDRQTAIARASHGESVR